MNRHLMLALIAAGTLAGACQSMPAKTPAVLERGDEETLAQVKTVLAKAVGRARIELGPGDPSQTPTISVLPPPLAAREDRSMAAPVLFDIFLSDDECYVVRRDTGEAFPLGVTCRAVK